MSEHRPRLRWTGVCLDCRDADALARFYCGLLGWEVTDDDGRGWIQLRDPAGGIGLNIQAEEWYRPPIWPETSESQHKMIHMEIEADDLPAAVALAIAEGGTQASTQPVDRDPARLRVMLDPAGHPFCLFARGE